MIHAINTACEVERCHSFACFGDPLERVKRFCAEHAGEGMALITGKSRNCKIRKCRTAIHVAVDGTPSELCFRHLHMQHFTRPRKNIQHDSSFNLQCSFQNCGKRGVFANLGDKEIAVFCSKHKTEGMVHRLRTCHRAGCRLRASFGFEGEGRCFCAGHKLEGMKLLAKTCESEGCLKNPSFNYPGQRARRFCGKHKLEGMVVGIKKKKNHQHCKYDDCFSKASHGFQDAEFCSVHKVEGMIDQRSLKCFVEDCWGHPMYCLESAPQQRFCIRHKTREMVRARKLLPALEQLDKGIGEVKVY